MSSPSCVWIPSCDSPFREHHATVSPVDAEIDGFILYLATERGLSTAYQLSLRQSLDALAAYLKSSRRDLGDVGTDELSDFLMQRKQGGLSAASLRITTVHLKVFFRWLAARGKLPMDPAEPLLSPRPEQSRPETLRGAEVKLLLESIDPTRPLRRRDLAILELFYASGLRLSELCSVRLEGLDLDEGFIRVTGKGNKTRIVPVGGRAREAVDDYLQNERPTLVTRRTSSEIFLSIRGGRLSPERVREIVKERAAYLAEANGMRFAGFNARDVDGNGGMKVRMRDILARVKMWLDVQVLETRSKHLGEPETLPM